MKIDTSVLHKEGLFTAILKTVSDGITVIDKDLKILFQNEAIYEIFGLQIGRYCYNAYRGRNEPCEDCIILEVIKDGKPRKGLRDIQLPDGNILWLEFFSGPYKDPEGNIIGAVEVVRDVTEQVRITKECFTLRREMERQAKFENIITQSKQMKAIFRLIERVASTNSTVLITGESGTGKELIAKAILFNSNRKDKPYVTLNCGAIPENLLESELFGHVKGAFTGAVRDHAGLIETSAGGTLFLDEVGEIPLSLQVKLLRFFQEGESRRVGDTVTRKFDVRIISATNRNLEDAVKNGSFREDLFFRLSVIPISIPPLRERKEDIPILTNHLLQRLCDTHGRAVPGISSAALKMLMDYSWPGNVRELENAIEYALHLTDEGHPINPEQLPPKISLKTQSSGVNQDFISIDTFTQQTILSLQSSRSEEDIARILGISRKNLWEKRKRWGIPRSK
ncbi:MAG: sigma 54-interacting transcriptional regulator [Proteobacteria bacterium]|nr:sigma 54-interacting transcriptional regulator [Pseudomonadota bacterium]MBU1712481.1 sigma 54-interacting transcriptional regulator [Pseudomonadota bacterium]